MKDIQRTELWVQGDNKEKNECQAAFGKFSKLWLIKILWENIEQKKNQREDAAEKYFILLFKIITRQRLIYGPATIIEKDKGKNEKIWKRIRDNEIIDNFRCYKFPSHSEYLNTHVNET